MFARNILNTAKNCNQRHTHKKKEKQQNIREKTAEMLKRGGSLQAYALPMSFWNFGTGKKKGHTEVLLDYTPAS